MLLYKPDLSSLAKPFYLKLHRSVAAKCSLQFSRTAVLTVVLRSTKSQLYINAFILTRYRFYSNSSFIGTQGPWQMFHII